MYKLLLCWRYLRTRYLALVCIVSVMLGVATLIVVNSVMGGFSSKLRQRLHGLISDVSVESLFQDGFPDPEEKMERIRRSAVGDKIAAMTPSIQALGMIQMKYRGQEMQPRAVHLLGIEPEGRSLVGGFTEFLTDPARRARPSFEPTAQAIARHEAMSDVMPPGPPPFQVRVDPNQPPVPAPWADPPKHYEGIIPGYSIGHYRKPADAEGPAEEFALLQPGDEVILITLSGRKLTPVYDGVVVVDHFKSEMSEYDGNYIFVPLKWLQTLKTMENRATHLQVKLKDYSHAPEVVAELRRLFPREAGYQVATWEEQQGPLLAAISVEKGILNVLLFLIIAVAGFGILAIFSMIVVEKTRDIGILKALGASNVGVMKIFLAYGLLLGMVGAVLGTVLGLALTIKINAIEHFLTRMTGMEVFPRSVYYFDEIPTDIQSWPIILVNVGALVIAVVFSILPAFRAALLHPVRALRYE